MYKDKQGDTINQGDQFIYDDDTLDRVYICTLDGDQVMCSDFDDQDNVWDFDASYLPGCSDKLSKLFVED